MKVTLTRKIGSLLFLSLAGALVGVGFFASFLNETHNDAHFVNAAGRQRMLAAEILAWAQMVAIGQEEDRGGLRDRVADFARSLTVLRLGGSILDGTLDPAPSELQGDLGAVSEHWGRIEPDLEIVADVSRTDPRFEPAYRRLTTSMGDLRDASHRVVTTFAARADRLRHRMLLVLAVIAAGQGMVFIVGLWVTRRFIVRPVLRLDEAARRISGGDFSQPLEVTTRDELATLVGTFNDMTGRVQQLLAALHLRRKHAERIVASVPAGLLVVDRELRVRSANRSFLEYCHEVPAALVGRPVIDVLGIPELEPHLRHVLATDETRSGLLYLGRCLGTGSSRHVRIAVAGTRLAEEKEEEEELLLVVVEDLSTEERLAALARRSEDRFHEVVENATDGMVMMGKDGLVSYFNRAAERMFGYPRDEVLGKPIMMLMPQASRCAHESGFARFLATGESATFGPPRQVEGLRKDGALVPIDLTLSVYRADGEVVFTGVLRDIAYRVEYERQIALQVASLNAVADPVAITDRQGTILWVNQAFTRQNGWRCEEAIGKTPRILKSGLTDPGIYAALWSTILAGRVWRGEVVNCRKDGAAYPADLTVAPVEGPGGEVTHFVATHRDLTEHRKLQAQLLQSQKMDAVGRLAGGVAHDFNNLLTVISGYTNLIMAGLGKTDPLRGHAEAVEKAADRAASLTRQLLAFSRKQILQPKVVDLNSLVANVANMLRRLIGEDIALVSVLKPGLGRVKADPGQIEQILMNLAVNARDAMPKGGTLTLETDDVELDEALSRANPGSAPGSYVMLAVSDTGCGMDAETRAHAFEPFFTTKGQGKGIGMGLAMVYGIVKQSGGYIALFSESGQGTTLKIHLPKVATPAEVLELRRPAAPPPRGTETILLVEDEDAVRMLVRGILEASGYAILEAPNGSEALLTCGQHAGPIQLLITDLVMPGMSGIDLAKRLAPLRPGMKILYMSGYTEHAGLQEDLRNSGAAFVQKPFTLDAFALKVREVLDSGTDRTRAP